MLQQSRAARPRRSSLRSLHPRSSTGDPPNACFPDDDDRPPRSDQAIHSRTGDEWRALDTRAAMHGEKGDASTIVQPTLALTRKSVHARVAFNERRTTFYEE